MTAIVVQVLLLTLIAAYPLQVAMTNVALATNVQQERAIANPMMNVKVDLSVEPKTVLPAIQATTIVV